MSSPFASRITATLDIPFDLPHQVTIQRLAGRHLERARSVFFQNMVQDVQARGGAAAQKDVQQLFTPDKAPGDDASDAEAKTALEKAKADPLNGLDQYSVVAPGIKSWTYPESLAPEKVLDDDGDEVFRVKAILDMDEDALKWFATEILRLTKPAAFQTADEQEADRKNA